MNIGELTTHGRVYVTYPPDLRQGVEEAVEAWKVFCALPEEVKLRLPYDADSKVSGNGYELKKGEAIDLKENFHMRVSTKEKLLEYAKSADNKEAIRLIETGVALNALMAPILREFGEAIEKEYAVSGFADDVMAMQPTWLLRFLHYFGDRKPGEEIAAPHVDKGGFTLHLHESAPGVERLTYDTREWESLPLSHDETVIIPGTGLQHRSKCQVRALCHRVVATEETADIGRYSAVCFFDFRHRRYFDKDKFGSQQSFAPGAFYTIPFEEYDKMFID